MNSHFLLRRVVLPLATGSVAAAAVVSAASCVIADPPAELPRLPRRRPVIVSTDPPTDRPLGTFPREFLVNVELQDPAQPVSWQVFVDYSPDRIGNTDPDRQFNEAPRADGGLHSISFSVPPPLAQGRCHKVEILVAQTPFLASHQPSEPGADFAAWTYSPTGTFDGCVFIDAGPFLDGSFPETGPDASADSPADAGGP